MLTLGLPENEHYILAFQDFANAKFYIAEAIHFLNKGNCAAAYHDLVHAENAFAAGRAHTLGQLDKWVKETESLSLSLIDLRYLFRRTCTRNSK